MSNRVRLQDAPAPAKRKRRINLMLDSGAFSAWQSGKDVNINDYIRWLQRHKEHLFSYVNMDMPPGGYFKVSPEDAAKTSDRNLQTMLDKGLRPLPVYHQYEPFKWLLKMVEDGHPYIGISSRLTLPLPQRIDFLNKVFSRLCDSKGKPCVRTHGFGMGAHELAKEYPFYTVDSTSWILGSSAYGRVLLPKEGGNPTSLYVGRINKGVHALDLDTQMADLERYMEEAGVTLEELGKSFIARAKLGSLFSKRLTDLRDTEPCVFKRWTSWFPDEEEPEWPKLKAVKPFKLKVFSVAWGNVMNHVLNEIDHDDRLMSYLQIKGWSDDQLARYMTTGFPTDYTYGGKN